MTNSKITFNANHKAVIDDMLLSQHPIKSGKMFGLPAYFVGGKLVLCLYENGVGIKLPAQVANELMDTDKNVFPFVPFGRHRMKEWVHIILDKSEDYRKYADIFSQSISYIQTIQEK